MTSPTGKATRLEELILACLLEGMSHAETAIKCGCAKRTVQRKILEPQFMAKFSAAKNMALDVVINRLRAGGRDAATRLHKTIRDPEAPPAVVVSASWRLLDLLLKADVMDKLLARVDKLEQLREGDDE